MLPELVSIALALLLMLQGLVAERQNRELREQLKELTLLYHEVATGRPIVVGDDGHFHGSMIQHEACRMTDEIEFQIDLDRGR